MRVLVTGGAGFIGGAVTSRLLDAGHDVVVLDVVLAQAWGTSDPDPDPRATFVRADVRDPAAVARALRGVDAVCHQAAMVGLGVDLSDLPDYVSHNELGTAVLLAGMTAAGVPRLVLASSMVVYGEGRWTCPDHGDVRPLPRTESDLRAGRFEPRCPRCGHGLDWGLVEESTALDPRSVYAATKVAQEHLASAWARSSGGSVVALRYHNVYGPRMPRDTPYAGVAALFRSALARDEPPRVYEDGGQMRDFVHVHDVAEANLRALDHTAGSTGMLALNLCSGQPRSILDMATQLAAATHGPPPVVTGDYRLGDVRHVVASPAAAEQTLGWRAAIGPDEGVAAFASDPLR